MKRAIIETLATGDEVVNGDVLDSNGAAFCRAMVRNGFLITRHNALPDDRELLARGLREISERADLCVTIGGLGPTEDDLTAEVVSEVTGRRVVLDELAIERMRERFARMELAFPEKSKMSARVPEGAWIVQNDAGTAPAFSLEIGRCRFFFLPGPPKEFKFFLDKMILPWVKEHLAHASSGVVSQFKALGWAEAALAERFADFEKLFPGIKVGYRAHNPEVWLKLTAEAPSREEALRLLAPAEEEVRRRIGKTVFATGDDELAEVVHRELLARKLRLAAAESCTGGRVASLVTANPGSSAYFVGGAVTYSNELKQSLLGVPAELLREHGAVSAPVAEAMARGARERFGADVALSVTGIAGPGGATADKPVGLTYLSLAHPGGEITLRRKFRGERDRVQRAAALTALEMLRRWLVGAEALQDGGG